MARKWSLLQLGTRIIVKGEEDIEGTIIDYFTDKGEIKGYILKLDDGSSAIIDLNEDIEIPKQ